MDVDQDRDSWLAWRREGVGGSDAAAVCGMDPRKGPMAVWLEKTGVVGGDEETPAQRRGRRFEPVILQMFTEETGLQVVRRQEMVVHPGRPWQRATLDGRAVDPQWPSVRAVPLEVKSVHWCMAEDWKDGVPAYYLVQVQHQLAVSGDPAAAVAALIGLDDLRTFVVARDEAVIAEITAIEERFWGLVQAGTPPVVDGTEGTGEALDRAYLRPMRETVELPASALEVVQRRREAAADIKAAKERQELAENELKLMLQDAEVGTVGDRPVVRWTHVVQHRPDLEALRKRFPRTMARYVKESSYRRFSFPRLEVEP